MRVIAVVNQKGGVGKTTTSVNLGAALALRGRRVLLVDLDPQGNLTDHLLGDPAPGTERRSIYDILVEGAGIAECVVPTGTPGLSVVPSHEDLAGAELDLAAVIGREVILRDALAEVPEDAWDYVFLDCPPSLGLLSLNALAAAHEVFIALQTEFFAMRGLGALDRTIDLVRRRINPRLAVGGIVPTLVDATRLSREVVEEVRNHYGDLVFATRVRTNIRLAEAPSYGKHIFDYAPDSPGAQDYAALARELEEGRPAEAAPVEPAAGAAPSGPSPAAASLRPAAGRPRGIARAIAEAMATLGVTPSEPAAAAPAVTSPAVTSSSGASSSGASSSGATMSVGSPGVMSPGAASPAPVPPVPVPPVPVPAVPVPPPPAPSAHGSTAPAPTEDLPSVPGDEPSETPTDAPTAAPTETPAVTVEAGTTPVPASLGDPESEPAAPGPPTARRASVPASPAAPAGEAHVLAAPAVGTPAVGASAPVPPTLRRAAVPLPVLRSGPRPLSLAPMPTRAPSALPRPRTAPAKSPSS